MKPTCIELTWPATPVWGCVLIGGQSSRMGYPKHLLRHGSRTWLEEISTVLAEKTEQVVLAGSGTVPQALAHLPRVADVCGLAGPLAGILAAFRQFPDVSWLVVACDQPLLDSEALQWLLSQRGPGCMAVLPDVRGNGRVEPLLAYYDRQCRDLLEAMAAAGRLRISLIKNDSGVLSPRPPASLRTAWCNINTPEELTVLDKAAACARLSGQGFHNQADPL